MKSFFEPWRREMRSYATQLHSIWWQNHSQPPPTACRLYVYLVCEMALCKNPGIVALYWYHAGSLKNPAFQTNGVEPDAVWCKWLRINRPVLMPQQLPCFWTRRSQIHSTTRFSLWQLSHLQLWFPIKILAYDLCIWTHNHIYSRREFFHTSMFIIL